MSMNKHKHKATILFSSNNNKLWKATKLAVPEEI